MEAIAIASNFPVDVCEREKTGDESELPSNSAALWILQQEQTSQPAP